jgi:hypothetical protein
MEKQTLIRTFIAAALVVAALYCGMHFLPKHPSGDAGMVGVYMLFVIAPSALGITLIGTIVGFFCRSGWVSGIFMTAFLMTLAFFAGMLFVA